MENALIEQLGINWKLLLSQAVNFFVLLIVLRAFVYKPLMKTIKERNAKIKEGLDKAEEANARLKEIDDIGKEKIKNAEQKGIELIKETEQKAKALGEELQKKNEERQKELEVQMKALLRRQAEETKRDILAQASGIIKKAIIKTVELSPEKIDDALIKKAVESLSDGSK